MLLGMLSLWYGQAPSPPVPGPPAVIQAAIAPFGGMAFGGRPIKRRPKYEDEDEDEFLAIMGIDLD